MNRLSLQGLADKINIRFTKQSLSKYELGQVVFDSEMIGILCEVLGIRPESFFFKQVLEIDIQEKLKLNLFPAKELTRFVEIAKDELSRYLELEQILGIETRFENPISHISISSQQDIEEAAQTLRNHWGLGTGPLSNVIELLENHHVKVLEIESTEEFDGFSTWDNGKNIPLIVLNKAKLNDAPDRDSNTLRWGLVRELIKV